MREKERNWTDNRKANGRRTTTGVNLQNKMRSFERLRTLQKLVDKGCEIGKCFRQAGFTSKNTAYEARRKWQNHPDFVKWMEEQDAAALQA